MRDNIGLILAGGPLEKPNGLPAIVALPGLRLAADGRRVYTMPDT